MVRNFFALLETAILEHKRLTQLISFLLFLFRMLLFRRRTQHRIQPLRTTLTVMTRIRCRKTTATTNTAPGAPGRWLVWLSTTSAASAWPTIPALEVCVYTALETIYNIHCFELSLRLTEIGAGVRTGGDRK